MRHYGWGPHLRCIGLGVALALLLMLGQSALPKLLSPRLALAADVSAPADGPQRERYRIDARSADSWAHYYQLIGLGTVHQGPHTAVDWQALASHCAFLEDVTDHIWIPLGYSIQRGYKLCFRPGPFSQAEAKIFCARLVMEVEVLTERTIVCERERDGLRYEDVNPYLKGL